jgi:hypothetical protein
LAASKCVLKEAGELYCSSRPALHVLQFRSHPSDLARHSSQVRRCYGSARERRRYRGIAGFRPIREEGRTGDTRAFRQMPRGSTRSHRLSTAGISGISFSSAIFPSTKSSNEAAKIGLWRLTANRISEIFGVRLTRKLRGKLATVVEQIDTMSFGLTSKALCSGGMRGLGRHERQPHRLSGEGLCRPGLPSHPPYDHGPGGAARPVRQDFRRRCPAHRNLPTSASGSRTWSYPSSTE